MRTVNLFSIVCCVHSGPNHGARKEAASSAKALERVVTREIIHSEESTVDMEAVVGVEAMAVLGVCLVFLENVGIEEMMGIMVEVAGVVGTGEVEALTSGRVSVLETTRTSDLERKGDLDTVVGNLGLEGLAEVGDGAVMDAKGKTEGLVGMEEA